MFFGEKMLQSTMLLFNIFDLFRLFSLLIMKLIEILQKLFTNCQIVKNQKLGKANTTQAHGVKSDK